MKSIINFLKEEEGVTAIEYALIAALVAVAAIAAWTFLGEEISTQATNVGDHLNSASGS